MSLVKVKALVDGIAHGVKGDVIEYPEHFAKRLIERGDAELVKAVEDKKPEPKKGKKK